MYGVIIHLRVVNVTETISYKLNTLRIFTSNQGGKAEFLIAQIAIDCRGLSMIALIAISFFPLVNYSLIDIIYIDILDLVYSPFYSDTDMKNNPSQVIPLQNNAFGRATTNANTDKGMTTPKNKL